LSNFPLVILSDMALSSTQAGMFSSYASGGGSLIAMHPDQQLAATFGVSPLEGGAADGYILPNPSHAVSVGITPQTLQCHGPATACSLLNGTAQVATLYSNATTSTNLPAIVTATYGQGRTGAFTYDLAKSVAYLRQGNPATAGTDVDGDGRIRTIDG